MSEQKQAFDWRPWALTDEQRAKLTDGITLDIAAPPCPHCEYWRPRIVTDKAGTYDGVVMCTADEMVSDFSCFEARQNAN